ncbi:MAG: EpsG family protein [Cetobacterium sp.]
MGVYLLFYSFNFFLSELYFKIKQKHILVVLSFIFLNIFLCLNYDNGIDWTHYQITYLKTPPLFATDYITKFNQVEVRGSEVFFVYLISSFKLIPNLSFEIFRYIILTIDLVFIYFFLLKYTKYPLIVILFINKFLTYMMFEPIFRQMQAMIIFFIAVEALQKRYFIKYYFLNMVAILFHSSAIILLPIYYFKKIKMTLKKTFLGFLFCLMIILLLNNIVQFLFSLSFLSHYSGYLTNESYGYVKNIPIQKILKLIFLDIGCFYFVLFMYRKSKIKIENFNFIGWCYFYSIVIKILSLKIAIFFRFNNYFYIIYVIYLCFLFQIINNKIFKQLIFLLLALYFGAVYIKEINFWDKIDAGKYKPYTNYIFVEKQNPKSKIRNRFEKTIDLESREKQMKNLDKID